MDGTPEIMALLLLPALGAGVCQVLREGRHVLRWTLAWVTAYAVAAALALLRVLQGEPLDTAGGWFFLDALSAYFLAVMAAVFLLSSASALGYFGREIDEGTLPPRIARRFGWLWAAALSAMTIVLLSNNLGIMWVGVELTTLATAFLIRLHVTHESLEATWKYLVICSVGVAFAFMGVVLFAASARGVLPNSADATMWRSLVGVAGALDPALVKAGFLFVLVGFGTKAGIAPMHAWLPDAHSQAPGPVSAVFSGTLLNTAMYCLMRFLPIVQGNQAGGGWALDLLVVFGLLSILLAGAFMVFQRDLKRLLAYSSVEHIGIVALGLGLGPAGAFAGLFHVLNHSTAKSVGFLSAGRLGQLYGTLDMRRMRGISTASPVWGGALVVSLLALIGVAPFAVFLSEFLVLKAAADAGAWAVVALFVLGTGVVFAGVLRHLVGMGWGEPEPGQRATAGPAWEPFLPLVPLGAIFALGLWMPALMRTALDQATRIIAGGA